MNQDFDEEQENEDDEIKFIRPLDAKDYLAIFIASLQTIFLPFVLLMLIMVVIALILQIG